MLRKNWHIILPLFVFIANMMDLTFTIAALDYTNAFREVNPVMRYCFDNYGTAITSIIKMSGTGLQCWIVWWVMRQNDRSMKIFLSCGMIGAYGFLMLYWITCWFYLFLC